MVNHYYQQIPGHFCYADLFSDYVKSAENGWKSLEIGGDLGCSTAYMGVEIVNSGKELTHYVVDAWIRQVWNNEGLYENLTEQALAEPPGLFYYDFIRNIEPVKDVIKPIRNLSVLAAATFPDESLDFIFLDASHNYDSVKEDILAWWPKLKPGRYMGGDDYVNFAGVRQAVDEIFSTSVGRCAWQVCKDRSLVVK